MNEDCEDAPDDFVPKPLERIWDVSNSKAILADLANRPGLPLGKVLVAFGKLVSERMQNEMCPMDFINTVDQASAAVKVGRRQLPEILTKLPAEVKAEVSTSIYALLSAGDFPAGFCKAVVDFETEVSEVSEFIKKITDLP